MINHQTLLKTANLPEVINKNILNWGAITLIVALTVLSAAWLASTHHSSNYQLPTNSISPIPPDLTEIEKRGLNVVTAFMDRSGSVTVREFGGLRKDGVAARDILVDLGSITKTVTAVAILKLVEKGQLELDEPLDTIWYDAPDDKASITVHELLTHTSGLTEEVGHDFEKLSREDFVDRVFETDFDEDRIGEYRYSNAGYGLLAAIIERRSGKLFEVFLKEDVLDPAGLDSMGYEGAYADDRSFLSPRTWKTGFQRRTIWNASWGGHTPGWNLIGNGGLVATSVSYLRFWSAVRQGRVIDNALLRKALTPYVDGQSEDGSYYGYGLMMQDTSRHGRVYWHDGQNDLFSSEWRELGSNGLQVFTAGRGQDAFEAMKLMLGELENRAGT
jgi:CubicO group peptidase (beta-lactamase class C family)